MTRRGEPAEPEPDPVAGVAEELYGLPPEDFVAARDARVAVTRESGDPAAARAIGTLRRPTRAAWLANLLARERADQLAALLELASELADAQRALDSAALRTLSAQRQKLVSAMAHEARRLAGRTGHPVTRETERDLRGILEAALGDSGIAQEVRAGRLTRTASYSGFGPEVAVDAEPRRAGPAAGGGDGTGRSAVDAEQEVTAARRAAAERKVAVARRAAAEQEVAAARRTAAGADERTATCRTAREDADHCRAEAQQRVAELTAALDQARQRQRETADAAAAAARGECEAATAARAAASTLARALARLDDRASGDTTPDDRS